MSTPSFELRPGVNNRNLWEPARPKESEWNKIRKVVLTRDNYTCLSCGHRAMKWMNIHHAQDSEDNNPANLSTLCVACHAILHMGMSLQYGSIEIWKAELTQVEIIRATREGVRNGKTLEDIKSTFILKRGKRAPNSIEWANSLLNEMDVEPRAELPKPLCAVFVNFTKWQIEA